jgi:predicted O-methyltransferase YrrM
MPREYKFTADWFAIHLPIWREIFNRYSPRRVLEAGSYEGRSACYLIEECVSLEELTCVDLWGETIEVALQTSVAEQRFDNNIISAQERRAKPISFRKVKGKSSHALATMLSRNERFDLIYIDGSHLAPDVLTDAVISFYLLVVGGIMIFDDYIWRDAESGGKDILSVPKAAINAFATSDTFPRRCVRRRERDLGWISESHNNMY